jgi:hypothetical protein
MLLLLFLFPVFPGLLEFVSNIIIYILELERILSLIISFIILLLEIYYYKLLYKSIILSKKLENSFIVIINYYRAILKIYLLLSYFIRKGLGLRNN